MNIDSISRGVVIDHIAAGKGMEIVRLLNLEKLTTPVAVIRNVRGKNQASGKKDIIKIEERTDVDLDVLGFIDPNITVNIIENSVIAKKYKVSAPNEIVNVVKCKNPRCITSSERGLDQVFQRRAGSNVYRCKYCEQEYQG